MLDEEDLKRLSPQERAWLARALAALDEVQPLQDPLFQRRRRWWLALLLVACVVLAAWIGLLSVMLPRHFTAGAWRAVWVGFDVALLGAFAATTWAAWRNRQVVIACMIVTATLLCCDAWFDLTLDWGSSKFLLSVLSAILVELPIAALLIVSARRLLRLTIQVTMSREGQQGPVPPLWRLALFGPDPAAGLRGRMPRTRAALSRTRAAVSRTRSAAPEVSSRARRDTPD